MPSLRSTVLAVASASLAAVANADYYVDPDSVPLSQRQAWCRNEIQTCPVICEQTGGRNTKVNECDPETLTYGCICADGKQPNVSEYSLTLPYFVCQEWGNQCVAACTDNTCSSSCREDNPCGAQDPKKYNLTSTTSGVSKPTGSKTLDAGASSTDESDMLFTAAPGSENSDDDSDDDSSSSSSSSGSDNTNASAALEAGRSWGLVVVLGTMFAGFAML